MALKQGACKCKIDVIGATSDTLTSCGGLKVQEYELRRKRKKRKPLVLLHEDNTEPIGEAAWVKNKAYSLTRGQSIFRKVERL